jgi:hypothetical protein
MARIETDHFLSAKRIEWAYGEARKAQVLRRMSVEAAAMRAARARDSKMLTALQAGAEHLQKLTETQAGQHGFDVNGYRVQHTEFQLWKNAYVSMDRMGPGDPEAQYSWIYVAAGILAGVVS